MNARKRRRAGEASLAEIYRDPIPLPDTFTTIWSSEGTMGGRLYYATVLSAGAWDDETSWAPQDDNTYALMPDGVGYDLAVEGDFMNNEDEEEMADGTESGNQGSGPQSTPTVTVNNNNNTTASRNKAKRSLVSKHPNVVWYTLHRQTYLDEIIRWSGRGDFRHLTSCPDCVAREEEIPGQAEHRCRECLSPDLTCCECCVRRHRLNLFHRIERWTGSNFVDISLKELGLVIQLNHAGAYCDNPIACHSKMLILHTNGIHSCKVQYCGCSRAIPQHIQLLRRRIYPASQLSTKTCATFDLLRHLHRLALTTKASTYDFYRCLEKSTTNLGIDVPKSRYRALMRMVLQWRHLQMLKWAGRGHDSRGAVGTLPGELMVKCPSCPHPGINLPNDWKDAPENMKFLYTVMICLDANFRLKNQMVSNYSQDPGLGLGLAYMIHRTKYEEYVKSRANEKDISTCVGFQALAKANSKFSKGLRYTGVGMGVCGRSEMILGVGNLHKGERYANMDYIFGTILKALSVISILASYDIACQWFLNLLKRMQEDWPPEIKPSSDMQFTPAIPKLHASMHKQSHANHDVFSLNLIPGAGQSDGECPERVWGPHNAVGNATKTMGPGSRQDTLDDHFGFWNWLKYTSMGTTLLKRYRRAVAD
uniref:CxC2-like cysteine cluster KDZ transposase-associated domain-containing protein n=1 Tax=Psilocybe cubensis TaxID=181762 RepID=A0A8H8CFY2_PSICU